MMLFRLAYFSCSLIADSTDEIDFLVKHAEKKNKQKSVTGLLMHRDGWFAQVLEGPRSCVCELYNSIIQDYRHCEVTLVTASPIDARRFPYHWMASVDQNIFGISLLKYSNASRFDPSVMSPEALLSLMEAIAREEQNIAPQNKIAV
jgi:hypothetical protein